MMLRGVAPQHHILGFEHMTYLRLFYEFAKIGLFAVGGGLATLPFLQDISLRYPHWFSSEELVNMIAISQSTPGPIGINAATYTGYNAGGALGGIVASFAVVFPALIFMTLIAKGLEKFSSSGLVKSAFYGLRPAVVALIASAAAEVLLVSVVFINDGGFSVDWRALPLFIAALALMQIKKLKLHPAAFILGGAVLGILLEL